MAPHWFACETEDFETPSSTTGKPFTSLGEDVMETLFNDRDLLLSTPACAVRVLDAYLPTSWRLTAAAGAYLARPENFASFPVLVTFNAFERMLVNSIAYSLNLDDMMEGWFLKELTAAFPINDVADDAPCRRFLTSTRFFLIAIFATFSLASVLTKYYNYPQLTRDILRRCNEYLTRLCVSARSHADVNFAMNVANPAAVLTHLVECRRHELTLKGCVLETLLGGDLMSRLELLVHSEYQHLLAIGRPTRVIDFNAAAPIADPPPGFDGDAWRDIKNASLPFSTRITPKQEAEHRRSGKPTLNTEATVELTDRLKVKKVSYKNYCVSHLSDEYFRQMIWTVLFKLATFLDNSPSTFNLRPTFYYFLSRHVSATLGCMVCISNCTRKFVSANKILTHIRLPDLYDANARHLVNAPRFVTALATRAVDETSACAPLSRVIADLMRYDFSAEIVTVVLEQYTFSDDDWVEFRAGRPVTNRAGDLTREDNARVAAFILNAPVKRRVSEAFAYYRDIFSFLYVFFSFLSFNATNLVVGVPGMFDRKNAAPGNGEVDFLVKKETGAASISGLGSVSRIVASVENRIVERKAYAGLVQARRLRLIAAGDPGPDEIRESDFLTFYSNASTLALWAMKNAINVGAQKTVFPLRYVDLQGGEGASVDSVVTELVDSTTVFLQRLDYVGLTDLLEAYDVPQIAAVFSTLNASKTGRGETLTSADRKTSSRRPGPSDVTVLSRALAATVNPHTLEQLPLFADEML